MLTRVRKLFKTPTRMKPAVKSDPADDGIEVAVLNLFSCWPDGRLSTGKSLPGAKTPLEYYKNRSLGPRR